jgi:hypothetical protein
MDQVHLQNCWSASQETPCTLWHPKLMAVFKVAGYWWLSWVKWNRSKTSHHLTQFKLIPSYHLRPVFPNFLRDMRHVPFPDTTLWTVQVTKLLVMHFSQPPVTLLPQMPIYLSPPYSLRPSDHVLALGSMWNDKYKYSFARFNIYVIRYDIWKYKTSEMNGAKYSRI